MSRHLYKIKEDDEGVNIRLEGKTAIYLKELPDKNPVCWDKNGKSFSVKIQKFLESYILTPLGDIEFPAYIDIRPNDDFRLLYVV